MDLHTIWSTGSLNESAPSSIAQASRTTPTEMTAGLSALHTIACKYTWCMVLAKCVVSCVTTSSPLHIQCPSVFGGVVGLHCEQNELWLVKPCNLLTYNLKWIMLWALICRCRCRGWSSIIQDRSRGWADHVLILESSSIFCSFLVEDLLHALVDVYLFLPANFFAFTFYFIFCEGSSSSPPFCSVGRTCDRIMHVDTCLRSTYSFGQPRQEGLALTLEAERVHVFSLCTADDICSLLNIKISIMRFLIMNWVTARVPWKRRAGSWWSTYSRVYVVRITNVHRTSYGTYIELSDLQKFCSADSELTPMRSELVSCYSAAAYRDLTCASNGSYVRSTRQY